MNPPATEQTANTNSQTQPTETILKCSANYGITEDTIIFYYSNSCGWCEKMKPGVEVLEENSYKIYWAEASGEESADLMNNCVVPYMESGGVPKFICVKTGEIKTGAFTDAERNLNQEALNEWAENCLV